MFVMARKRRGQKATENQLQFISIHKACCISGATSCSTSDSCKPLTSGSERRDATRRDGALGSSPLLELELFQYFRRIDNSIINRLTFFRFMNSNFTSRHPTESSTNDRELISTALCGFAAWESSWKRRTADLLPMVPHVEQISKYAF